VRVPDARLPRARRRTFGIVGGVAVIVFLIISGIAASFYTDLLWFKETGFTSVFWREVSTKGTLGAVFGLIFAALLLVNLWVVQRITSPYRLFTAQDQILERYRMTLRPYVRRGAAAMAIVFGLFAGSGATTQWRNWLLFNHNQPFGEPDPIFGKDLGFYVFRLPFHRFLFSWTFSTLVVLTIIVGLAHYFMGGIRQAPVGERVAPAVKAHLSVLFGLIVLLKAWGYRLDQFNLLYSSRGSVDGASYTDVHAQLPALRLLVFIAIVCGILFLVNIRFRGWTLPTAGIAILAVTSIAAGAIYPAVVQRLRVAPAERDRETPFIQRNIKATRAAFGIEGKVTSKTMPPNAPLTREMLGHRKATVENIRLWKPELLADIYTQLQRITNFYEFLDVDVDRYDLAGTRRQVMLSAREIHLSDLPERAQTWVNQHLVYTHGYGVAASRVNEVSREGQPRFIISDIPLHGQQGAPPINEPRVYFGENTRPPFVVVHSQTEELDFPQGQTGFARSRYAGSGGISLKGFVRRLAFAWRFRDINLILSSQITPESRIMFRRGIADRVRRVAPFLQLDADPYLTISDGRLVWVLDAYTTTSMYPYSERINLQEATENPYMSGHANYIRNSVKATVDAFDGNVSLYVWDDTDPIIRAWREIFPDAFKPKSQIPASLIAHIRYPENLFQVQADRFALYHIKDPVDFYTRTDVWQVANDPTSRKIVAPAFKPYYVLMTLPGSSRAEFVLMTPFTPFSTGKTPRQNMTSWLAARSDPEDYGKLTSYEFGKEQPVSGPEQVFTRMLNDSIVASQLALLDPTPQKLGIIYGNLLVVPIDEAILYVMPVYRTTAGSQLPELKRVIVVAGDRVSIGDTLSAALDGLFTSRPSVGPSTPATGTIGELIAEALAHYTAAQEALKRQDFATYGAELRKMEEALRAANAAASPSPAPAASR
jgi:uncharacterized protein